jgi:hypothetical protein
VQRPPTWLKFVDAGDVDDEAVDFEGMNVESPTGEHLGDVEGFIVDADSLRPYYVVVDAGSWLKSKHFLLPVGHARLDADADGEALVTSISRDRINRFPGFDRGEFEQMSDAELKRFNDETCSLCAIEGVVVTYGSGEPVEAAWNRADFTYPDWWHAEPTQPDRMGESALTKGVAYDQEREQRGSSATPRQPQAVADDRGRGASTDVSPHFDGRAQPGDVLGIETGGERTEIGDTSEDENKRRDDAEKASKPS